MIFSNTTTRSGLVLVAGVVPLLLLAASETAKAVTRAIRRYRILLENLA